MPSRISWKQEPAFSGLIAWGDFHFAIVESPTEVRLFTVGTHQFRPEDYDSGTLFGPRAELRWRRRRNGLFHTVLLHDDATEGQPVQPSSEEDPLHHIILWGEPQGGAEPPAWYEPRIPRMITEYLRRLAGKRVAVSLKRYRLDVKVPQPGGLDPVEKAVILFRCADIVEAKLED